MRHGHYAFPPIVTRQTQLCHVILLLLYRARAPPWPPCRLPCGPAAAALAAGERLVYELNGTAAALAAGKRLVYELNGIAAALAAGERGTRLLPRTLARTPERI